MTLYRTYRPQRFSDLIGQDAVVQSLQQALIKERVGHAYLFTGPRGTGKTSTARIFARASVCQNPSISKHGYEPCNTCRNCQLILTDATPDLVEIDAASNRGIEDIRELREQVRYHPTALPRKIYIIDEVHMLTTEAFNALLKTLEEPPEYCIFMLATTELHKVPVTIRSRCQVLRLNRGSRHSIIQKLEHIASQENVTVEPAALSLISGYAEGGFRDAESLFETLIAGRSTLTESNVRELLGTVSSERLDALAQTCLTGDLAVVSQSLSDIAQDWNGSVEVILSHLIRFTRDLLHDPARRKDLPVTPHILAYALEQYLEASILHKHSPVDLLPLELACLTIARFASSDTISEPKQPAISVSVSPQAEKVLPKTGKASEKAVSQHVTLVQPQEIAPVVPVIELSQESYRDLRKAWKAVIDTICQENLPLGQALKETIFHTAENGVITIHVRFKFHADKMNEKPAKSRVQGLLQELTDQTWEVHYHVSDSIPKRRTAKAIGDGVASAAAAVFGSET